MGRGERGEAGVRISRLFSLMFIGSWSICEAGRILLTIRHEIMVYGSTPYVGVTPKKDGSHISLRVHK